MLTNQMEDLWKDWYEKEKPKKVRWAPGLLLGWGLIGVGLIVICAFSVYIGIGIAVAGFICMVIPACKYNSNWHKLIESARMYCLEHQIYDTDTKQTFPFLLYYQQYVMGGKTFHYKQADVSLYDEYYSGSDQEVSLLIEIVPKYEIGEGTPVWKKDHLEVPPMLGLDEKLETCISKILFYQQRVNQPTRCIRNENKFYIYVRGASRGLIVMNDGQLCVGAKKYWKKADDLIQIIKNRLGD